MQLENGVWAWDISLSKYVRDAVKHCEDYISKLQSLTATVQTVIVGTEPIPDQV